MNEVERIDVGPRFAQAVVHGGLIYLAGQVADDPSGDAGDQAQQVFDRIDRLLSEAGSSKSNALSMTVWLRDMSDYEAFNKAYDDWVDPANKPARATVQARLIADNYRVEIALVAHQ